jgi:hypothetical protein
MKWMIARKIDDDLFIWILCFQGKLFFTDSAVLL